MKEVSTKPLFHVYVSGMDEVHGPFEDELIAHREANGINATIMHSHSLQEDLKHMPHCVAKVVDHLDKCRLSASFLGLPHECNERVGGASKSTMVELVDELKKLPQSEAIDVMIAEALAGEYHDYKNEKYVCGKWESSSRLHKLGFPELAQRIEQGEFDEEADEADKAMMRKDLEIHGGDAEALAGIFGLNPTH